jgi:L-lactate dehydrogenase complex protein LldG
MFSDALRALGGNARRVTSGAAAAAAVEDIVRTHGDSRRVLTEPGALIDELGLKLALSARGVQLIDVAAAGPEAALTPVGLTCVEVAIARSGTLLVGGRRGGWSLASVLPRVHVALLRPADIVPDLTAAFPRFERAFAAGQRNWVWVSGPSKTADIAMQMVTGVHGPNALEVLIVGDEADA